MLVDDSAPPQYYILNKWVANGLKTPLEEESMYEIDIPLKKKSPKSSEENIIFSNRRTKVKSNFHIE